MNRNLAIGLSAAVAMHAIALTWSVGLARPVQPLAPPPEIQVRTVREQIELPPPPPPEPKLAPEPPPPKPTDAVAPVDRPASPRPRSAQPKSNRPPPPTDAKDEPPPLVLSQTYGSGGDPGVAVNRGDEDSLGDPDIDPTEANVRRRLPPPPVQAPVAGQGDGPAAREVRIVHAVPKGRCKVEWPEGAEPGNRVVEVRLALSVSSDGKVLSARILRGAGEPFDSAAIAALEACAFLPATRDGMATADKVPFVVEFKPNGQ